MKPLLFSALLLVAISLATLSPYSESKGLCEMATLGGVHESQGGASQNSAEIEGLARFAVEEHNKKEVFIVIFLG
jgi:hypothetical protein